MGLFFHLNKGNNKPNPIIDKIDRMAECKIKLPKKGKYDKMLITDTILEMIIIVQVYKIHLFATVCDIIFFHSLTFCSDIILSQIRLIRRFL